MLSDFPPLDCSLFFEKIFFLHALLYPSSTNFFHTFTHPSVPTSKLAARFKLKRKAFPILSRVIFFSSFLHHFCSREKSHPLEGKETNENGTNLSRYVHQTHNHTKEKNGKNYPFGLILNANFSFRSLEELFANHARLRQGSARHICPTPRRSADARGKTM